MLAQNFLTSADLGISQAHIDALILTLGVLERGEIVHLYDPDDAGYIHQSSPLYFNMATWADTEGCSTVACIGGTAELLGGVNFSDTYVGVKTPEVIALDDLFYPSPEYDSHSIIVSQAATALRNYLTTGKARWEEIL